MFDSVSPTTPATNTTSMEQHSKVNRGRPYSVPALPNPSLYNSIPSFTTCDTPTSAPNSARDFPSISSNDSQCDRESVSPSDLPQWAANAVWSVEGESTPRIPRYIYEHALCEQMDETTALAMYTNVIEKFPRSRLSLNSPLPQTTPLSSFPLTPHPYERAISPTARHQHMRQQDNHNRCRRDREWETLFTSPLSDTDMHTHLTNLREQQQQANLLPFHPSQMNMSRFSLPSPQNGLQRAHSHSDPFAREQLLQPHISPRSLSHY